MNIVILSDVASINGGAAKIALDGASALASAGQQVHLVYGSGPLDDVLKSRPNLTTYRMGDFDIVNDPNRLRAMRHGWWNTGAGKFIGELLDSLDPTNTVVHVHSWTRSLSSSVIRAALDRDFETVLTLHDFLIACPTGTLFQQTKQQKCTLRPLSLSCICSNCDVHSYPHKLWRVGRRITQQYRGHIPSHVKHYIVYSELARKLLAPYVPEDASFHHVPNAIEVRRQPPVSTALNDSFISVGRLTPEKGVELFARAAAGAGVPCRFVGEGPAREAIVQANPSAQLSGWMSHEDGLLAIRSARALVFPSLWYETLGLVVLEAAGCGIPSIVPDSCAARESVVNGVTGLYFKSGDQSDLEAKIAILNNPCVAARMGKAAYERFWAPPGSSLALHGRRLIKTYESILNARYGNRVRQAGQYASA